MIALSFFLQDSNDDGSDDGQDATGIHDEVSGGTGLRGLSGGGAAGGAGAGGGGSCGGGGAGGCGDGSRGGRRGELRVVAAEDALLALLGGLAGIVGAVVEAGHDGLVAGALAAPVLVLTGVELGLLASQAGVNNVSSTAGRVLGGNGGGQKGEGEDEEALHFDWCV